MIDCDRIEHRKLPLSIQTTNVKATKGFSEWWSLLAVSGNVPINFQIFQLLLVLYLIILRPACDYNGYVVVYFIKY